MKKLALFLFVAVMVLSGATQCFAPTATASFSAVIPSRVAISLSTDTNSAATNAAAVEFRTYDDQDTGAPVPTSPGFMYAPKRSLVGKNWHIANIVANGAGTVTLGVTAALSGITVDKLSIWYGGFFVPGDDTVPDGGGATNPATGWEAMGTTKTCTLHPFTGTMPFNYRLNVATAAVGTYTGTLTYTLIQL